MNRTARELGLKDTHFENPHGLTARTHKSTARDLASLARTALETPGFSDYVGTRRHGSRLVDPSGVARDVIWANTNKLLGVDGYDGVKTGTTDAAGACLVASGRRGEAHLIVVVLGSASSESRYVDSRNIFRWGWRRLEQAAGSKS
jgi:D-alanyl-D-alanine carboxypeptidase (penicillin-binding protein 5/6)